MVTEDQIQRLKKAVREGENVSFEEDAEEFVIKYEGTGSDVLQKEDGELDEEKIEKILDDIRAGSD